MFFILYIFYGVMDSRTGSTVVVSRKGGLRAGCWSRSFRPYVGRRSESKKGPEGTDRVTREAVTDDSQATVSSTEILFTNFVGEEERIKAKKKEKHISLYTYFFCFTFGLS